MWLWVCEGQMDSVIAKPIGMTLRSSFFKNGTSDAMMDKTLSANAKKQFDLFKNSEMQVDVFSSMYNF